MWDAFPAGVSVEGKRWRLRVEVLTQLVGGCDNVSRNARVQIGVHDAQRVQLGHVVPPDLQGATQNPPRTGQEEEE